MTSVVTRKGLHEEMSEQTLKITALLLNKKSFLKPTQKRAPEYQQTMT